MANGNTDTIILIYSPAFCMPASIPGGRDRPPLGLLHIGAALRHAGFHVRLFDFQDARTSWEEVEECLSAGRRPIVGFTCDSDSIFRVLRMSEKILSRFSSARVVLGGPHVTYSGEPYISERRMVVRGDGELPMVMLAEYLVNGKGTLASIPGLMYESDGEIRSNPAYAAPVADVNALPCPDYSLLAFPESYWPIMTTSRGCPHRCHFCSEGNGSRGYRPRSIESIERELVALSTAFRGKIGLMGFADDTFTSSADRVRELCDLFERLFPDKKRFSFFCEGRVDVLARNPELVFRLRNAGMVRMQIGIEAGDQAMLDRMNKGIRREDIEKVVETCAKADVSSVQGVFICGLPGQTETDVLNEIEYAKHLVDVSGGRLETSMTALSALPGTEFRVNAEKWGLRILDAEFVTGALLEGCFSETASLSKSDIVRLCRLFNTTLGSYIVEKASWWPPDRIKRHFTLAADGSLFTGLLKRFIGFLHLDALLDLRRRPDYRFLFELPEREVLDAAPVRLRQNTQSPRNGHWVVNGDSPFRFAIDAREHDFYEYFNGKLSFREIGPRVAAEQGRPAEWGIEECMRIYRKCEDKLSCILTA
jgi:anaerobic magnesium-protoporphyrin IX monomethyl ester cyclase